MWAMARSQSRQRDQPSEILSRSPRRLNSRSLGVFLLGILLLVGLGGIWAADDPDPDHDVHEGFARLFSFRIDAAQAHLYGSARLGVGEAFFGEIDASDTAAGGAGHLDRIGEVCALRQLKALIVDVQLDYSSL
jgi:hypothetical protein